MGNITYSAVTRRNKFSSRFKFFSLLLLVLLVSGKSWGQSVIYSTNFGTADKVAVNTITGWTSSGTQAANLSISSASASSTYTLPISSSAGSNLADGAVSSSNGTAIATLAGQVNTTGYSSIGISFGYRGTATYTGTVTLDWSSDGSTWNSISLGTLTRDSGWRAINGTSCISLPSGAENQSNLRFRFTFVRSNTSGNFRIDDFTVIATPTTLYNYYSKPSGNLNDLNTWGTNADGSGTSPSNFTSDFQIFNIQNTSAVTTTSAWTVSGRGSKIVAGNGTDALTLTIASGAAITGTMDVSSTTTLIVQDATIPTFGSINPASTVVYDGANSQNIVQASYGNLTLSSAGKKTFAGGLTTVLGNLVINNTTLDAPGATPFATLSLGGNLTYQGTVTNPVDANSITLVTTGTGTQTITGNGNTARWFRILTSNSGNIVNVGTTTNLYLGNTNGGGIVLATGTNITINGILTLDGSATTVSYTSPTTSTLTFGSAASVVQKNGGNLILNTGTYGAATNSLTLTPNQLTTAALSITSGNTVTWAGTTAINADSRIEANSTGQLTLSGAVSGSGLLLKQAAGTLVLSNAGNSLTGGTQIGNGTITVNSGSSMGIGALTMSQTSTNSTTLNLNNTDQTVGSLSSTWTATTGTIAQTINLGTGHTFTINQSTNTTYGTGTVSTLTSILAGSGNIIKSGTGTLTLTSGNTYTGSTTISGGTLQLNYSSGNTIPATNNITVSGGTLQISKNQTIANLDLSGGGSLTVDAGATLTITGTYTGGTGTINNQGTIVLQGSSAQSFPGGSTVINNGTSGLMTNLTIDNATGVTIDNDLSVTTLSINPNAKLTNSNGKKLTVSTFNINSSASGTGTYVDKGGNTVIKVTANVQQYLSSVRNWYISSPVSNAGAPAGYTYYNYDETGKNPSPIAPATANWVSVSAGTTMTPGVGYIAQVASGTPTVTFIGSSLNTDNYGINLTVTSANPNAGFNLVGNPYPSYLDWTKVSAANTNLNTTFWYRTQTLGNAYVFDTYNANGPTHTNLGATTVSNLIPPMQGFWVKANADGANYGVTPTMQSHADVAANSLKAPAQKNTLQQELHLIVSNGTNKDETVLCFNPNASNGYDAYDSPKRSNTTATIPEIYTVVGNEELVINGMNTIPTTGLPLGFRTGETKDFTINASQITNMDANTHIILKDNLLNVEKDLTDGSAYTFSSDAVNSTTRFTVIFRTGSSVTGLDTNSTDNGISVYKNAQNRIVINISNSEGMATVYNTMGEKMATRALTSSTTVVDYAFASGVYLVSVISNGKTTTQKIIIN